jgi:hypothetical protein
VLELGIEYRNLGVDFVLPLRQCINAIEMKHYRFVNRAALFVELLTLPFGFGHH